MNEYLLLLADAAGRISHSLLHPLILQLLSLDGGGRVDIGLGLDIALAIIVIAFGGGSCLLGLALRLGDLPGNDSAGGVASGGVLARAAPGTLSWGGGRARRGGRVATNNGTIGIVWGPAKFDHKLVFFFAGQRV